MDAELTRAQLAGLIESLATGGRADAARLAVALRRSCWPGDGEGTDELARHRLRRSGPRAFMPVLLSCTCAAGRCRLCN
jgi:hypothetical protein